MRLRELWLDRDGTVIARKRILVTPEIEQYGAAVAPVFQRLRCDRERAVVALDCLGPPAQINQHVGAVAVGAGKIGGDRERAVEARERLPERAGARQRHAEQDMRARAAGIDGERLARMDYSFCQPPFLAGGERKSVELLSLLLQHVSPALSSMGSMANARGSSPLRAILTIVV